MMAEANETPLDPPRRGRLASVMRSPGFWLNFLVTLLLTCWLPGLRMRVTRGHDGDGEVLQEVSVPLYSCYWRFFQGEFSNQTLIAMGMHIGIVFVVTLLIWLVFASRRKRTAPAAE